MPYDSLYLGYLTHLSYSSFHHTLQKIYIFKSLLFYSLLLMYFLLADSQANENVMITIIPGHFQNQSYINTAELKKYTGLER